MKKKNKMMQDTVIIKHFQAKSLSCLPAQLMPTELRLHHILYLELKQPEMNYMAFYPMVTLTYTTIQIGG